MIHPNKPNITPYVPLFGVDFWVMTKKKTM